MTTRPHINTHMNMEKVRLLAELCRTALPRAQVGLSAQNEVQLAVEPAALVAALTWLQKADGLHFAQLMDVTAVDYLGYAPEAPLAVGFVAPPHKRFAVVYHLLSVQENLRVRVKCAVDEGDVVPSVVGLFPAANWYEREVYDMFGITFGGHPDLRRILTDYDFVGHPLRKDFPLNGHTEVYYDSKQKRVAHKPIDLPQELRHFDKLNPWKAATGNAKLAEEDAPFAMEGFK